MTALADAIRNIPLFSGLSREDIAKVLGKFEEISFGAGTIIFAQGDPGDAFYVIESGGVQVLLGAGGERSEIIGALGPLDCFGEMALLSGEPRSATIVAVKETALWKLSCEAWNELIQKHPTWLLQFCATLSKKLANADRQSLQGWTAFESLANELYESKAPEQQQFLRRAALLTRIDAPIVGELLRAPLARAWLADLENKQFPFLSAVDGDTYAFHPFLKKYLMQKLGECEDEETVRQLHREIAAQYEKAENWEQALPHWLEARDWPSAARLLTSRKEELLNESPALLRSGIERIPQDQFVSDLRLVHLKAAACARLGDVAAAVKIYQEALSRELKAGASADAFSRYMGMADALLRKGDYGHALSLLRGAIETAEQDTRNEAGGLKFDPRNANTPASGRSQDFALSRWHWVWTGLSGLFSAPTQRLSLRRWIGGILGVAAFIVLWFFPPDIDLSSAAIRQLAFLCLTLIFWVFQVFPEYGVALIFALGMILSGLGTSQVILGGFASTTWFMTLGVLGLGAAITSSGLFYRLSLQLVRFFPLNYNSQVLALGFMGIVVMALIPQQSARTAIISQMLLNLSESLGYKNPSKASTGLFAASFLGLGQLGFLFLTGSTTSLMAWGLLPPAVRLQFTWGYWFIAALPPTLVVVALVLVAVRFLYQPETQAQVSYRMVQNQLGVLGPLSRSEWITLGVLGATVGGWLTSSYHGIDGAWIALLALCVLANTGVLGLGMLKKAIDWELLLYMGITLSIPPVLTHAKIDHWLVDLIAPVIQPFAAKPVLSFIVIALITYATKLVFTSFLTVVTLTVALLPLASQMGLNPWVVAMIILIASEVWFFPFQVDWHTMAYGCTEGKGFSYSLMYRVNPIYALAYIVALMAAIPYWRYLGLM
jgi:anion transporter